MHGQCQCKSIAERLVVLVVQKVLCKHAVYNKIFEWIHFYQIFFERFYLKQLFFIL